MSIDQFDRILKHEFMFNSQDIEYLQTHNFICFLTYDIVKQTTIMEVQQDVSIGGSLFVPGEKLQFSEDFLHNIGYDPKRHVLKIPQEARENDHR